MHNETSVEVNVIHDGTIHAGPCVETTLCSVSIYSIQVYVCLMEGLLLYFLPAELSWGIGDGEVSKV